MTDEVSTGTLPEQDPATLRAMAERTKRSPGTGLLGGKTEVMLLIGNDIKRFVLTNHSRWILGRFEQPDHPDQIDLLPYDAHAKGVSRFHLQLHVEDDHLLATDLNSTNGSYLSGEPLTASKPKIVRNGDVLMLGRLAVQVLFR